MSIKQVPLPIGTTISSVVNEQQPQQQTTQPIKLKVIKSKEVHQPEKVLLQNTPCAVPSTSGTPRPPLTKPGNSCPHPLSKPVVSFGKPVSKTMMGNKEKRGVKTFSLQQLQSPPSTTTITTPSCKPKNLKPTLSTVQKQKQVPPVRVAMGESKKNKEPAVLIRPFSRKAKKAVIRTERVVELEIMGKEKLAKKQMKSKKMIKKVKKLKLKELKDLLTKKKLIQKGTNAPESVLRTIVAGTLPL